MPWEFNEWVEETRNVSRKKITVVSWITAKVFERETPELEDGDSQQKGLKRR